MKRIQGTAKAMGFRVGAFGMMATIVTGQILFAQQATQSATPPGIRPASGTGHTTTEQAAAHVAAHGTPTTTAMVGVVPEVAPGKAKAEGVAPQNTQGKPAATMPAVTTPPH